MARSDGSALQQVRNRHFFLLDILFLGLAPSVALLLRVDDMGLFSLQYHALVFYSIVALAWKSIAFLSVGLYTRYWRYASLEDMMTILKASVLSGLIGVTIFFSLLWPTGWIAPDFPRSVIFIDSLLTLLIVAGNRLVLLLICYLNEHNKPSPATRRVLIAGGGAAGALIVRELLSNPQLGMKPVGVVDDDTGKFGLCIHGVEVLGKLRDLPALVREYRIEEVVIAMPVANGQVVRDIVRMCQDSKVASRTVPSLSEIISGAATLSAIRDVKIEDLLRRDVVRIEADGISELIRGSRVMVTGGGGSIGSELCRQISEFDPSSLVLLGHGENSLFHIAEELQLRSRPLRNMQTIVADIRDRKRMDGVFRKYNPQIVFHAAAHKHVGLMESNIPDAITNNVNGTLSLVNLCNIYGVERFVMISSDKAVNPTTVMGVTKRIAELIVHDAALRNERALVTVRFGNVLGSRGSVVPIFNRQIARGGPVTVSHPDVERYFMTIPEAVQLILRASTMAGGGEVFVLDMGAPIKIIDLARDLIRLSGKTEGKDIKIVYTGLKNGEKLSERLFFAHEEIQRSKHNKIFVTQNNSTCDPVGLSFRKDLRDLIQAANNYDLPFILYLLKKIVPEFECQPNETNFSHVVQSKEEIFSVLPA